MEFEEINEMQAYMPPREAGFLDASNIIEALEQPAGRFRPLLSLVDRLTATLARVIQDLSRRLIGRPMLFLSIQYPVSPNWRLLLEYLYREKIIASPQVSMGHMFHDEPKFFYVSVPAHVTAEETDGRVVATTLGSGSSHDFEEALSKAVGEHLERLLLIRYRKKDFLLASSKELRAGRTPFLDPKSLQYFSEKQKKDRNLNFDEDRDFFWVKGQELTKSSAAWIPAQLVYWNYILDTSINEPFLWERNTNGAGGHFTREEAILSGLHEVIQRDAFLVYWLNSMATPRIAPKSIPHPALQDMLTDLSRYHLEAVFLDTTLDMPVSSCICVIVDHTGRGPKIALGGGCGFPFKDALASSFTEALAVRRSLRYGKEKFTLDGAYRPFESAAIDRETRLRLWSNDDMYPRIAPFLSGAEKQFSNQANQTSEFSTPAEELDYMVNHFRSRGYQIYVYEVKANHLKKLGYHAVKVISPQLVPLYLNEINASLGSPRLKEAPQTFHRAAPSQFNPWPHPFP